jgi:hypothetical protein
MLVIYIYLIKKRKEKSMNFKTGLFKGATVGTLLAAGVSGTALAKEAAPTLVKDGTAIVETLAKKDTTGFTRQIKVGQDLQLKQAQKRIDLKAAKEKAVFDNFSSMTPSQREAEAVKQRAAFKEQKENAGWVDKIILQPIQGTWTFIANKTNRCYNKVVDTICAKEPASAESLKKCNDAITFNQACKDNGTEVVASLAAAGAGACTGGAGAPVAYGALAGGLVKPLIKGTSTNNTQYTVKQGIKDSFTGALEGWGGASLTYQAPKHVTTTSTSVKPPPPPVDPGGI